MTVSHIKILISRKEHQNTLLTSNSRHVVSLILTLISCSTPEDEHPFCKRSQSWQPSKGRRGEGGDEVIHCKKIKKQLLGQDSITGISVIQSLSPPVPLARLPPFSASPAETDNVAYHQCHCHHCHYDDHHHYHHQKIIIISIMITTITISIYVSLQQDHHVFWFQNWNRPPNMFITVALSCSTVYSRPQHIWTMYSVNLSLPLCVSVPQSLLLFTYLSNIKHDLQHVIAHLHIVEHVCICFITSPSTPPLPPHPHPPLPPPPMHICTLTHMNTHTHTHKCIHTHINASTHTQPIKFLFSFSSRQFTQLKTAHAHSTLSLSRVF